jgi:Uncharacterized conserved protein
MDGNLMYVSSFANPSFLYQGRGRRGRKRKVGLFVDLSNIFLSVRQLQQSLGKQLRTDYEALLKFAQSRGRLTVAKMYTAYNPERQQETLFFLAMRRLGYQIVREPLIKSHTGENHGNLDTVIAYDITMEAPYLDVIILVSGDGDFAPLIRRLNYSGKYVIVIGVEGCTNANLIIDSNEFVPTLEVPGFIKEEKPSNQVTPLKFNETVVHPPADNGR